MRDVVAALGGHEAGEHLVLVGELVMLLHLHAAKVCEVCLVPYQRDAWHRLTAERALNQREPVFEILEALVVGNVVAEQHCLSAVDVVADHLASDRLPTNVPDLQRHLDITWQHQPLHEKVDADRLFVLLREVIIRKPHRDRRFADRTVTQDDHLVLELFAFVLRVLGWQPGLRGVGRACLRQRSTSGD